MLNKSQEGIWSNNTSLFDRVPSTNIHTWPENRFVSYKKLNAIVTKIKMTRGHTSPFLKKIKNKN
jgi:hypothetical protein